MKTIIFDFGNVVGFFDHQRTIARLAPFTDMTAKEMYEGVYAGELEEKFESGRMGEREFLEAFIERCGLRCDPDFLAGSVADIFWPNAEVIDLLPRLKPRYRLLLGSNTNPLHSRHFLKQFEDELSHFHALVLSHDIGVRKPKAGFFTHCHRLGQCDPQECVFVDDIEENILGAREVGLKGIVYRPHMNLEEALGQQGIVV